MAHIVDLFYRYHINTKTTVRLGWYNLLFSDPVTDDSKKQGFNFDSNFFDTLGPHFFITLTHKI